LNCLQAGHAEEVTRLKMDTQKDAAVIASRFALKKSPDVQVPKPNRSIRDLLMPRLQAGHAEEVERLKTESDAQKDAAVAALRAELEGRLAEQTKELTAAQDMLRGAVTHTAELEETLEVIHCFQLPTPFCMHAWFANLQHAAGAVQQRTHVSSADAFKNCLPCPNAFE